MPSKSKPKKADPLAEMEKTQAEPRDAIEQAKALAQKAEDLVQEVKKASASEA